MGDVSTGSRRHRAAALVGTVCLLSLAALSLVAAQQPPPLPPGAVLRVGGDIKEPRKVKDARPRYPREAQEQGVSGRVILDAVIATSGKVESVRVLRSVPLLDAAAVAAVRQWEYEPALLHGTPVAVVMTVLVNFALEDDSGAPSPAGAITVGFLANPTRLVTAARAALRVHDSDNPQSLTRQQALPDTDAQGRRSLSPDGRFLAFSEVLPPAAPRPGSPNVPATLLRLLDVITGRDVTLGSPTPGGLQTAFSADARTLLRFASGPSRDTFTYLAWRVPEGNVVATGRLDVPDPGPIEVAVSPNGDRFAFTTFTTPGEPPPAGHIHVVETLTGKTVTTLESAGRPLGLTFDPSGQLIYWSHEDRPSVQRAEAATGRTLPALAGRGRPASAFVFANDGRLLLGLGRADRTLRIWDTSAGVPQGSLELSGPLRSLAVSQDGQRAAVGLDNRVTIIDISTPSRPRLVMTLDVPRALVVASPVGR